jgi:hypothetical protein
VYQAKGIDIQKRLAHSLVVFLRNSAAKKSHIQENKKRKRVKKNYE